MWLNQLFLETPIDYKKRLRTRIRLSAGIVALGFLALLLVAVGQNRLPVLYLEPNHHNFVSGFYIGLGCALIASGLITIWKSRRILRSQTLFKQHEIEETDERNRMLGLRCWAYAGYSSFALLYISILVSGFISVTVMKVLLCVMAVYALLLLLFRILLKHAM